MTLTRAAGLQYMAIKDAFKSGDSEFCLVGKWWIVLCGALTAFRLTRRPDEYEREIPRTKKEGNLL